VAASARHSGLNGLYCEQTQKSGPWFGGQSKQSCCCWHWLFPPNYFIGCTVVIPSYEKP